MKGKAPLPQKLYNNIYGLLWMKKGETEILTVERLSITCFSYSLLVVKKKKKEKPNPADRFKMQCVQAAVKQTKFILNCADKSVGAEMTEWRKM